MGRYKGYRKYICKKISLYIEDFMEICNGVDYLDQVKELIIEYTKRLGRDLSFQNIDEEL